ncbi:hypothetical protein D3C81_1487000 [compost metagenome]
MQGHVLLRLRQLDPGWHQPDAAAEQHQLRLLPVQPPTQRRGERCLVAATELQRAELHAGIELAHFQLRQIGAELVVTQAQIGLSVQALEFAAVVNAFEPARVQPERQLLRRAPGRQSPLGSGLQPSIVEGEQRRPIAQGLRQRVAGTEEDFLETRREAQAAAVLAIHVDVRSQSAGVFQPALQALLQPRRGQFPAEAPAQRLQISLAQAAHLQAQRAVQREGNRLPGRVGHIQPRLGQVAAQLAKLGLVRHDQRIQA